MSLSPELFSIALTEHFTDNTVEIAVTGSHSAQVARSMKALKFNAIHHTNPNKLKSDDADVIIAVHCSELFDTINVFELDGKLHYEKDNALTALTEAEETEARQLLRITRQEKKLPIGLNVFLEKLSIKMKDSSTVFFIDSINPGILEPIAKNAGFKVKRHDFASFVSKVPISRMRVLNKNIFLAGSPHPATDSESLAVLEELMDSDVVPFADLEKNLTPVQRTLVLPYVTHYSAVFKSWSEYGKDILKAGEWVQSRILEKKGRRELYSILSTLDLPLNDGIFEKSWDKIQRIRSVPHQPQLFVFELRKV